MVLRPGHACSSAATDSRSGSPYTERVPSATSSCVLIPVKAFSQAKLRLASVLSNLERAELAQAMASIVVSASAPLPTFVACEDEEVASWAESVGAKVQWTPGRDLNGAVQEAVARLQAQGMQRVVVCHADLPFAQNLAALALADPTELILVADRRGQGTNVISVPTGGGFTFSYGAGSFPRHQHEATVQGLSLRVVQSPSLSWDVDEPEDLQVPSGFEGSSPLLAQGRISAVNLSLAPPKTERQQTE